MRSKLFVPASRPELYEKALNSAADALSFDLEDAVSNDKKPAARTALNAWLAQRRGKTNTKKIIVRINPLDTPDFASDLAALAGLPVDLLNLPKIESAAQVNAVVDALDAAGLMTPGLLVNIETPKGLRLAAEIAAAHPRVEGLQLGLADLFEPLGIARYESVTLHHTLLQLRLAAGESGRYVVDSAYAKVSDPEGFRHEAARAHVLGFIGKSCIHPSQIALANTIFSPSQEDIARAERIVAAAQMHRGTGAFLVDGQMIDAPFLRRAEDVLRIAKTQSTATPSQ